MTETAKDIADRILGLSMIFGLDTVIETQKAQGQSEVVNSSILPKRGDWDLLQSWGIEKLDDADNLFFNCILPEGWKKKATNHPIHSYLLDDRGLRRAHVMYKAAFYDRDARINCFKSRFTTNGASSLKDFKTAYVYDYGRDICVAAFERMQYASMDGVLGALLNGKFYSDPRGYTSVHGEEGFNKCVEVGNSTVEILTLKGFEDQLDTLRIEDNDIYHKFYVSLDQLVDKEIGSKAKEWIKSIPSDNSQWRKEYDFPEVATD